MFRKMLETIVGPITDTQFRQSFDLATSDIKFNRITFGRRTSLNDAIKIAVSCFNAMGRGKIA